MNVGPNVSFVSMVVAIFFIFNALALTPLFLALLAPYEHAQQKKIIIRETLIALGTLLIFTFFGSEVLTGIGIAPSTISIGGGFLLLLISLTLIFPKESTVKGLPHHEPFIVPLAIPGLAGPGSMATVMMYGNLSGKIPTALALLVAWVPSFIILYFASYIKNYLGEKGIQAVERLGGMLICFFGVQMVSSGVVALVKAHF